MKRQLFWFGIVGAAAMVMHYALVAWLLVPAGLRPLLANIVAFLLAFQVSYWGHRSLTFQAKQIPHQQAMPRFFGVACLSFLVNETLYALLLYFTSLNYRLSLLIVLACVAGLTFILGKCWAFAGLRLTA